MFTETIGEPQAIPFSFYGPGWYVVLAALLVLMAAGLAIYVHIRRKNRYRREAVTYLKSIENTPESMRLANELLKRICLTYANRPAASLRGTDWINYLNSRCKSGPFTAEDAKKLHSLYTTDAPAGDPEFIRKTTQWIRNHGF